jgi:tetratricopeptide (TPR) repeat protein
MNETPNLVQQALECLQRGQAHLEAQRLQAGIEELEQVPKLLTQAEQQASLPPEVLRLRFVAAVVLGDATKEHGQTAAAQQYFESAFQIALQTRTQLGDTADTLTDLSIILGYLADLERDAGRPEQARPMYEEMLKLHQQIRTQLGDRPDTLRDVSISLGRLADLELDAGRPEQARPMYEEALKLKQQIRTQLGDRPDTLRDVCVSLSRLADLERDAGRLEQARQMYEEALKLDQQICTQLGDTQDTLRDLSMGLERLAGLEHDAGRPEQARPMYEEALKLRQQIRTQLGDRPDTLRDVSISLGRLADLERDAGRPEQARLMYEDALKLDQQIRTQLGDTPDTLRAVSVSLERLADLERDVGRPEQARPMYKTVLKMTQQIRSQLGDTPATLRNVSISLGRLADLERDAGHPEQARLMYEEALKLRQQIRSQLGDRPDTLRAVSVSLGRLADLERDAGRPDQARLMYEEALKMSQQVRIQLGDRPDTLRGVSISLGRLADLALRGRDWPAAADHALQAAELTIQSASSRQERPILDMTSQSFQLARISRSHPPARDQAWPLYERMASKVNSYAEFNDPESTVRARPAINQFHAIWLGLALDTAAHRVPPVLGASQGRKVTALVMHELQRQASSASATPELQALLRERERGNHLALALGGGASVRRSAFGDLADMTAPRRPEVPAEVTRARTEALWAEHRKALEACEAARSALIAIRPEFAEFQPKPDRFELKRLQQGLTEDSALVLLVQAPESEDSSSARAHRIHALLIRAKGDPVLRPLPQLDALPNQLQTQRLGQTQPKRGGALAYRDCQGSAWRAGPQGESEELDPAAVALDVQQALRERLWAALQGSEGQADLLAGLHQLYVVSHGELHGLPLALGAPEGLTVSLYPGLVYYWLQRQRGALAWPAIRQLRYQFYSPEEAPSSAVSANPTEALAPIPHVYTEAVLVGSCWAERDELLRPDSSEAIPATVLHLACHGTLEREGQEDPCLILSEKHRLNLIELLQGAPSAPIVYLSACMVGRTREDLDGDPLGLVGGFMLRGARCVIAALNPISDFYAPLLAYLFHRCLQMQAQAGQPLDAVAALAEAKEQVRSGDWGSGEDQAQQAVIEAYAPRLQQQLEREIRDAGSYALLPKNRWANELQGWLGKLIPALGGAIFNLALELADVLEAKLTRSEAATTDVTAGRMVAEQVVAARAKLYSSTPAVQHLLVDVQAFG